MDTRILDTLGEPGGRERIVSRRNAVVDGGKLGAAGLAAIALPAAVAAFFTPRKAVAQQNGGPSVQEVLNFALTLEFLEAEYYRRGLEADTDGQIDLGDDRPYFEQVSAHEDAHVAFLQSQLGDEAISQPEFDFTGGNGAGDGPFDPFNDTSTFVILAQGFEDTGVRAYKGQAPNLIQEDEVLQVALRIHSVEARHASVIRRANRERLQAEGLQGWIRGAGDDSPEPLRDAGVYEGEDNTTHVGADASQIVSADAATEAFDEPLTMEQVLEIADPFIAD